MEKVYEIELRVASQVTLSPQFYAVQSDTGTRKIKATILNDDGTAFIPDSGTTAKYLSKKADGTGTEHSDGVSVSGNVVTVELTEQDLAAPGRTYAAIVLMKDGAELTAMPFWFTCQARPVGSNVKSSNDYQDLEAATQAANNAASHAPYIRSSDLHWMAWDLDTQEYIDTGVPASGVDGSVLYSVEQTITNAQKEQARSNIGAASAQDLEQLITDLKAGTRETANYHLGFYRNENGYICQLIDTE